MPDIVSERKRSQIMSRVQATETKPEILVRKFLFSKGYRFRKNVKALPGSPDIVLRKLKTTIFVHGCFWHGHKNCTASDLPKSNVEYWSNKITGNIKRDLEVVKQLKKMGWKIIEIWECHINTVEKREKYFSRLHKKLITLTKELRFDQRI